MSQSEDQLASRLRARFGDTLRSCSEHVGELTVEIAAAAVRDVCTALKEEPGLRFRQLVDLCGIDYLDYGKADWETSETTTSSGFSRGVEEGVYLEDPPASERRFGVVYHLLSHELNQRLRIRVMLDDEPPRVDSVVEIWPGADWYEREAFDLFGILFRGHPDLRRILTDYGFIGHPFRKDFPLIGEVEMRYDPEKRRVVYEPVSIEPRTLVPKVIRHGERHEDDGRDHEAA